MNSLAFRVVPLYISLKSLRRLFLRLVETGLGGSLVALPHPHAHLSWKSYRLSLCVTMAEKEGLNDKAYQMSVGHGREGRFHEDGSPSPVFRFTLSTVFKNHVIVLFKAMCKWQYTKNHSIPIKQVNIWKVLLHLWL